MNGKELGAQPWIRTVFSNFCLFALKSKKRTKKAELLTARMRYSVVHFMFDIDLKIGSIPQKLGQTELSKSSNFLEKTEVPMTPPLLPLLNSPVVKNMRMNLFIN